MKRKIIVGLSWPYANANLHIGHLASSVPADVIARYHRMMGDDVLFVSGTDCHGTKPSLRAMKEGVSPREIVDRYFKGFSETFAAYGFSFDLFSRTCDDFHKEKVRELVKTMYENGHIEQKLEKRPFCEKCNKFVVDTEIQIKCPMCGASTKADNCDCGFVPTEKDLEGAECLVCGSKTFQKESQVLVFKVTHFEKQLKAHFEKCKEIWRPNTINETKKYLDDLRDRDFSRDLDWGIEIPIEGFKHKKIWVWWEALLGYVTNVMRIAASHGFDWEDFWKEKPNVPKRIYMVHAKDNITFHTIMLPAMLFALEGNWSLPEFVVSSEYLTENDKKISKTGGSAMTEASSFLEKYDPESLRYYFVANGPEKKDSNFTEELLKNVHNTEIVNKFGNLCNRTLKFKGLEILPNGTIDNGLRQSVQKTYASVSEYIEKFEFKKAADEIMELVAEANRFYDNQKPWEQFKEDKKNFDNTISSCAYVIANLSNLFEPIMPKACAKIRTFLNLENPPAWKEIEPKPNVKLDKVEPLFARV